jgi:hypothetical protein
VAEFIHEHYAKKVRLEVRFKDGSSVLRMVEESTGLNVLQSFLHRSPDARGVIMSFPHMRGISTLSMDAVEGLDLEQPSYEAAQESFAKL